jgi:hypothetical protein
LGQSSQQDKVAALHALSITFGAKSLPIYETVLLFFINA